jgi:hypothetical protein
MLLFLSDQRVSFITLIFADFSRAGKLSDPQETVPQCTVIKIYDNKFHRVYYNSFFKNYEKKDSLTLFFSIFYTHPRTLSHKIKIFLGK